MKFLLRIIFIAGLIFLSGMFLPWPIITLALSAFLVGLLFGKKPRRKRVYGKSQPHRPMSFWSGFIASFVVWGSVAYWLDKQNESVLSGRIFGILPIDFIPLDGGPMFLGVMTALVAGVLGGMASLSGQLLGEVVK